VLTTLRRKRDEIERMIVTYEKRLAGARRDLAHVTATIQLFEAATSPSDVKVYQDVHRLFRRGEIISLCKEALSKNGPMDTRQLSHYVMKAKGFKDDNELRKSIALRIVQAMRMQSKRGVVKRFGKKQGAIVWGVNTQ
jgi:hypothetical protein